MRFHAVVVIARAGRNREPAAQFDRVLNIDTEPFRVVLREWRAEIIHRHGAVTLYTLFAARPVCLRCIPIEAVAHVMRRLGASPRLAQGKADADRLLGKKIRFDLVSRSTRPERRWRVVIQVEQIFLFRFIQVDTGFHHVIERRARCVRTIADLIRVVALYVGALLEIDRPARQTQVIPLRLAGIRAQHFLFVLLHHQCQRLVAIDRVVGLEQQVRRVDFRVLPLVGKVLGLVARGICQTDQGFEVSGPKRDRRAQLGVVGCSVVIGLQAHTEVAVGKIIRRALGSERHDPAKCVCAVQRRNGALRNFYLFDETRVDETATNDVVESVSAVAFIHTHAVTNHHDAVGAHAAHDDVLRRTVGAGDIHTRLVAEQLRHIGHHLVVDVGVGHDGNRAGNVFDVLLEPGAGHDDVFNFFGIVIRCVVLRQRGGRSRRQQGGGQRKSQWVSFKYDFHFYSPSSWDPETSSGAVSSAYSHLLLIRLLIRSCWNSSSRSSVTNASGNSLISNR